MDKRRRWKIEEAESVMHQEGGRTEDGKVGGHPGQKGELKKTRGKGRFS